MMININLKVGWPMWPPVQHHDHHDHHEDDYYHHNDNHHDHNHYHDNDQHEPEGRVAEVAASATGIVDRVKQLEGGVEQSRFFSFL